MEVGQRVKVCIRRYDDYANGAAVRLDRRPGVIEEFSPRGATILVKFDRPVESWWSHGSEVKAFWFPVKDVEAV